MGKKIIIGIIIIGILIYLGATGKISFESKDGAIANNAAMQGMFKQAHQSREHKKEAEETWMEKYFNINF